MHINLHKPLLLLAAIATSMAVTTSADEIKETYISPTRIVWMSDNSGEFIKEADNLLKPFCGQVAVADPVSAQLRSTDTHTASILLDFGKEIHGGIEICSAIRDSQKQLKIHLCFGESVTEALSSVADGKNPYNATNEHSLRDFDAYVPWLGSVRFGNTGFRFVRIDLLDTNITYPL
ncbi:MAG: alpha-L-rhamnosidase, partial [Muribaculaceae bacterium]